MKLSMENLALVDIGNASKRSEIQVKAQTRLADKSLLIERGEVQTMQLEMEGPGKVRDSRGSMGF